MYFMQEIPMHLQKYQGNSLQYESYLSNGKNTFGFIPKGGWSSLDPIQFKWDIEYMVYNHILYNNHIIYIV